MADTCPTVKIKDSNAPDGFVVINEEDFDEKVHTKYVEKAEKAESTGDEESQTKAELIEAAEAKGITVKAGMTKANIQELLDLDSKSKAELVEMAEAKGLDTKGTKADLVNALAKEGDN